MRLSVSARHPATSRIRRSMSSDGDLPVKSVFGRSGAGGFAPGFSVLLGLAAGLGAGLRAAFAGARFGFALDFCLDFALAFFFVRFMCATRLRRPHEDSKAECAALGARGLRLLRPQSLIAVVAAIPSASVSTAATVNAGRRANALSAYGRRRPE